VFLRHTVTGTTVCVSVSGTETQANAKSTPVAVSDDGRFVLFNSSATDLGPGDTNQQLDAFLRDRHRGTTIRMKRSDGSEFANGADDTLGHRRPSIFPDAVNCDHFDGAATISANGRYVGFACSTLHGERDAYVFDRTTLMRTPVAATATASWICGLSQDGRYVAFMSDDQNVVPGDTNGHTDVFVRDRTAGNVQRASVRANGSGIPLGAGCGTPPGAAQSMDGTPVGLTSSDTTVVPSDTNSAPDVFLRAPLA
jgi:hypothetical protein